MAGAIIYSHRNKRYEYWRDGKLLGHADYLMRLVYQFQHAHIPPETWIVKAKRGR